MVLVSSIHLLGGGKYRPHRAAVGVFAMAAVVLFGLSGSYHMLEVGGTARAVLRRADHAAIFTMIAGTFTAVHGVAFRGRWRWAFLAVVWFLAIAGLTLKIVFFESVSDGLGLALYLGLGWVGVLSIWALWRKFGWPGTRALVWGGLAYSAGAVYDHFGGPAWIDGVIGPHEVFHLAVLAGALLHWQSVRTLMAIAAPNASKGDSERD